MLVKAYGLRFIIVVSGNGGKFNFIPLLTTIGAGSLRYPIFFCLKAGIPRKHARDYISPKIFPQVWPRELAAKAS